MPDESFEQNIVPRDGLPLHLQSAAVPPEEVFENLTPLERQAVIAYVEAGSYAEALTTIDHWRSNEGKNQDDMTQQSSKLFAKKNVRKGISRLLAFWADHSGIQAARILDALETQAFADPALIYHNDGHGWELKPIGDWPLHMRQTVQKIHYTETTSGYGKLKRVTRRVNVEFVNRQTALELLGKHLRLFDTPKEQAVPFTLVVNTSPADQSGTPKQIGPQVIDGIGLQIRVPEPEP